jgi:hypothetical protein
MIGMIVLIERGTGEMVARVLEMGARLEDAR